MHAAPERIQPLNDRPVSTGKYVLYWMQQSQRAEDNPALDTAVTEANRLALPVVVGFGLTDAYPEANLRHLTFMLEGLQETARALDERGIRFILRTGDPARVALELGGAAALIVCDRGYLRHQKQWREEVARSAACRVMQVEADAVVPVGVASTKAEYAARTLRPKLHRLVDGFLDPAESPMPVRRASDAAGRGLDPEDLCGLLGGMTIDRSVPPVSCLFQGGTGQAKQRFTAFVEQRLGRYAAHSNQPQTDDVSFMSPYLHFGQISPVWLARRLRRAGGDESDRAAYLEELIVRRELAVNFVEYTPEYDRYACLPNWARQTLAEHLTDPRPRRYNRRRLDAAASDDPYWNAAMREMKHTGFMHNYMRMYWGKKVLEWSGDPQTAYADLLWLNNRYFLDGRDPNSYAGVAWIFGMHDRAWPRRPVFGKVRSMTASGLRRKCDIDAYVAKVDRLVAKMETTAE